jgi:ComF family protein
MTPASIRASRLVYIAVDLLGHVVAPPRCSACDERVASSAAFCPACAATVEPASEDGSRSIAAFAYGGAIATAIRRMKHDSRPDLARPLGDLLSRAVQSRASLPGVPTERFPAFWSGGVVVPVPLHPSRLAERGFNQAALIARRVARSCQAIALPLALARTRNTPSQQDLARDARIANVAGAFRVRRADAIRGRAVLLVDDVCTTGATLAACTVALFEAGAALVTPAVVARVVAEV